MRPPNLNLCRGDFCETDVVSLTPGARDRGRDACRIYCYRSGAGREPNTECILRIILLAARAASFNRKSVSGGFWIVGKRAPFRSAYRRCSFGTFLLREILAALEEK